MGGCFLNADMHSFELCAAEDIAAADDQADLAADVGRLLHLAGDLSDLFHADAALTRVAEAFAGEF